MSSKTLLVDCDTGIDDAIALLYLLGDPTVELCGITTVFGNVSPGTAARNTLAILDLVGRTGQVPVSAGSGTTLIGETMEFATHVHGDNGLGGVELPPPRAELDDRGAVDLITQTARRRPGEVHLLATGPLTNVAMALRAEPRLPQLLAGLTIMGGAALAPGNITAAAEANIWHDPEAAELVLTAPWPVLLVPLDATMKVICTEDHRAQMAGSTSPVGRFAADVLDYYFDFYKTTLGRRCAACHDALAATLAVGDVTPARALTVPVTVETGRGPARGETVCDTRVTYAGGTAVEGANCTVVLETSGDAAQVITDRICSYAPSTSSA